MIDNEVKRQQLQHSSNKVVDKVADAAKDGDKVADMAAAGAEGDNSDNEEESQGLDSPTDQDQHADIVEQEEV